MPFISPTFILLSPLSLQTCSGWDVKRETTALRRHPTTRNLRHRSCKTPTQHENRTPSTLDITARVQSDADAELELSRQPSTAFGQGKITLIGVGPGTSCGQLTVAGEDAILSADVVLYDRLTDVAGLKERYGSDKRFEHVGKRGSDGMRQDTINERMMLYARRGLHVVRVKGGDVSIFGRMQDELRAARENGVEVDVVAGVSTPSVVAARLQFPLTKIGKGVCFVSGHDGAEWMTADLLDHMTVVVFMGLSNMYVLLRRFNNSVGDWPKRERKGKEEEVGEGKKKDFGGRDVSRIAAVAVQDVMSARERIVWGTVGTLSQKVVDAELESPVLVVIGDVVRLAKDWPFERE